MKLKSPTHRFLESLAEAVDSLNIGTNLTSLNPTIAVLSALILTGTVAFSYSLKLSVLIFAISVALVLLAHSPIRRWARILLFILAWATMVSIPLPFITFGAPLANLPLGFIELKVSREGLNVMITFILRVVAAAATFTSFCLYYGLGKNCEGIRRFTDTARINSALKSFHYTYTSLPQRSLNDALSEGGANHEED